MRLTAYTDYTLRTLMYLAVQPEQAATIAGIAATYGISEAHLTKIVHQLGLSGEVATTRGRGGGLRLGKPAEAINLGAVVRRTEPDMDLVPCFGDSGGCAIDEACVLSGVLRAALDAFLAVLDRYSLADLVAPRRHLSALLHLDHTTRKSP
ncbi:MAG: Rrf2 family transcriptional regulator [Rhodospirillales bacterium]